MIRVIVPTEIRNRLSGYQGYRKALDDFAGAVEAGLRPKRIYKPSGVDRKGDRFEPYIELDLWHHHLGRKGDPLLVVQRLSNEDPDDVIVVGVALTTHAEYFGGDKLLWLKEHSAAIDWSGHDELRERVLAHKAER